MRFVSWRMDDDVVRDVATHFATKFWDVVVVAVVVVVAEVPRWSVLVAER